MRVLYLTLALLFWFAPAPAQQAFTYSGPCATTHVLHGEPTLAGQGFNGNPVYRLDGWDGGLTYSSMDPIPCGPDSGMEPQLAPEAWQVVALEVVTFYAPTIDALSWNPQLWTEFLPEPLPLLGFAVTLEWPDSPEDNPLNVVDPMYVQAGYVVLHLEPVAVPIPAASVGTLKARF